MPAGMVIRNGEVVDGSRREVGPDDIGRIGVALGRSVRRGYGEQESQEGEAGESRTDGGVGGLVMDHFGLFPSFLVVWMELVSGIGDMVNVITIL